jgi:hypothetical protein
MAVNLNITTGDPKSGPRVNLDLGFDRFDAIKMAEAGGALPTVTRESISGFTPPEIQAPNLIQDALSLTKIIPMSLISFGTETAKFVVDIASMLDSVNPLTTLLEDVYDRPIREERKEALTTLSDVLHVPAEYVDREVLKFLERNPRSFLRAGVAASSEGVEAFGGGPVRGVIAGIAKGGPLAAFLGYKAIKGMRGVSKGFDTAFDDAMSHGFNDLGRFVEETGRHMAKRIYAHRLEEGYKILNAKLSDPFGSQNLKLPSILNDVLSDESIHILNSGDDLASIRQQLLRSGEESRSVIDKLAPAGATPIIRTGRTPPREECN